VRARSRGRLRATGCACASPVGGTASDRAAHPRVPSGAECRLRCGRVRARHGESCTAPGLHRPRRLHDARCAHGGVHGLRSRCRRREPDQRRRDRTGTGGTARGDAIGQGRGELHETPDQGASFAPLVKSTARAASTDEIPSVLAEAWRRARTPPSGPVYVEVPFDVLHAPAEVDVGGLDGAREPGALPAPAELDRASAPACPRGTAAPRRRWGHRALGRGG